LGNFTRIKITGHTDYDLIADLSADDLPGGPGF
jgi:hypothetical protein